MNFVFLDFETAYSSEYSLTKMTYEQYIRDERFRVHGLSYKVNDGETFYVYGGMVRDTLRDLFPGGNDNIMIAHNAMFDGAIASWVYGVKAKKYYCTEAMSRALWNQRSANLETTAESCFPDDPTIRKGHELEQFKGRLEALSNEDQATLGGYCINDTEVMFKCFSAMYRWLPDDFFGVMDIVLQMFINPVFVLDRDMVVKYLDELEVSTAKAIEESGLPRKILASNEQFAEWILSKGMKFEQVPSPTPTKPDNMKWPLAKNAVEFLDLQAENPNYAHVWRGRTAAKSTIEISRSRRVLEHAEVGQLNPHGLIALPLKVSAAHTHRLGGTNKVNPQNFKRKSPLRYALKAPPGQAVVVADASNIESRMLAWVAEETTILEAYRQKRDLYCEFATDVFGRTIVKDLDVTERFVGKVCELGLGFQMAHRTLQRTLAGGAMGGPQLFFPTEDCRRFVNTFRAKHPQTVRLWNRAQGFIQAMAEQHTYLEYKCLVIEHQRIRLPDGLYLNYPGLRGVENVNGGYDFEYWNGDYFTNIYGGKLVENVVQALAQCLLRWHMLKIMEELDTLHGRIALQVHDEIVAVVAEPHAPDLLKFMLATMRTQPDWLNDGTLVLDAEGGFAANYSK